VSDARSVGKKINLGISPSSGRGEIRESLPDTVVPPYRAGNPSIPQSLNIIF